MEHQLLIGKYTLESLTSGLYVSPLDLYREYIQNAADSIDEAIESEIIENSAAVIHISINSERGEISILDNGTGVSTNMVLSRLIDIGNSQKRHTSNRGFRGIGRLSGLGYCQKLGFKTSAIGEHVASEIEYDSESLQKLLSPQLNNQDSVEDVLQKVVKVIQGPEKENSHYFLVVLKGVPRDSILLDYQTVLEYLRQNLPLPFANDFVWGSIIHQKLADYGVSLAEYNVKFSYNGAEIQLYKPYENYVLSDRVRRIEDNISDVQFREFKIDNGLSALLWYAETNFYGTVLNNAIKGIRVRQGNIVIGGKNLLKSCFKEERFNGWLVGELHVFDERMIPNTRRDDYEKNVAYVKLREEISAWATEISKQIRHKSYMRSLTENERSVIKGNRSEATLVEAKISSEDELDDMDESESVAQEGLINSLSILLNMGKKATRYNILNLNSKMTVEQKNTVAHVFDILYDTYPENEANDIARSIVENF